jgi:hypothetical protein
VSYRADLAVLFEHPEWQKSLFRVLDLRQLKRAAEAVPRAAATV